MCSTTLLLCLKGKYKMDYKQLDKCLGTSLSQTDFSNNPVDHLVLESLWEQCSAGDTVSLGFASLLPIAKRDLFPQIALSISNKAYRENVICANGPVGRFAATCLLSVEPWCPSLNYLGWLVRTLSSIYGGCGGWRDWLTHSLQKRIEDDVNSEEAKRPVIKLMPMSTTSLSIPHIEGLAEASCILQEKLEKADASAFIQWGGGGCEPDTLVSVGYADSPTTNFMELLYKKAAPLYNDRIETFMESMQAAQVKFFAIRAELSDIMARDLYLDDMYIDLLLERVREISQFLPHSPVKDLLSMVSVYIQGMRYGENTLALLQGRSDRVSSFHWPFDPSVRKLEEMIASLGD